MKTGFYPRLAFDAIRKNKRMYFPYILTCIGMVMMHYIMTFLQYSDVLSYIRGAETVRAMIGLGGWVVAIFACVFLFYTNSFLIRRRKKEFGLYNVLGMGKGNIGKVLFWEVLIIAVLSLGIGLAAGISFSKIAELGMVNILQGDVQYALSVSLPSAAITASVFGVIFVLLFLNALRQVWFSSVIALIRSENVGEKPPRANFLFGILGILILAAAYYIAVTIQNPITAMVIFFLAVVMVIIATYMIMISGSVMFCRILQKKKNYYYKSNHFVSVSSMVYRMKRNGAGLASICILVTMVLVMVSSTTSLYFGGEDSLRNRYPREVNMTFDLNDIVNLSDENISSIQNIIHETVKEKGATVQNFYQYRNAYVSGLLMDDVVETDVTKVENNGLIMLADVYQFYFVPLADYNAVMGTDETLAEGEAIIYTYRGKYEGDTISFNQGNTFRIKKQVDEFVGNGESAMVIIPSMAIIVPDLEQGVKGLDTLANYKGDRMVAFRWIYNLDTGLNGDEQIALNKEIYRKFQEPSVAETYGIHYYSSESREAERENFYGITGGFFYLGIMLSIVFILAAVLIIYYKQISEGYEDQARFEIMQKVGMTKQEIRKSINSQLLTVFFLPLIFAVMHLAFAFPIIRKLLLLFNLNNVILFVASNVISVIVFAFFYTIVYRITSNAYYKIVSGAKEI